MKKLKLYIETSAWNFIYADDAPEKQAITIDFFNLVEKGIYDIYISEVVIKEFAQAKDPKKSQLFDLLKKYKPTELEMTQEIIELAEKYLEREIIPKKKVNDALHVAVASVYEIDALISWNFDHLANLRKSEFFNGVNLEMGYTKKIEIITPSEVSKYES